MNAEGILINKIRKYKLNEMFPFKGLQPYLRKHTNLILIGARIKVEVRI